MLNAGCLDAPGVLHPVMIRSIKRRRIIMDSNDREDSLAVGEEEKKDEGAKRSKF